MILFGAAMAAVNDPALVNNGVDAAVGVSCSGSLIDCMETMKGNSLGSAF